MFLEDMSYDRYKEVEEYWIPNPYEEPIILVQYLDGTNDVSDGWHRIGLAFRNNLKTISVILGVEKIIYKLKRASALLFFLNIYFY